MKDYLLEHDSTPTPQSDPLRPGQVENSAGGFVWAVDDWTRLRRFLILGSEGGSYYASERDLTKENVAVVKKLAASDGLRLVDEVVAVSTAGRAPKNDPALYALACAISLGDKETKRAAAMALPDVARIGTHLYHFVAYAEQMRGWGRTLRWAVANWYDRNPEQLALQAVKYRQRDGWSHRDLLRLAHPTTSNADTARVFDWIAHRELDQLGEVPRDDQAAQGLVVGFDKASRAETPKETARLVREYGLPREALRSEHLTDPEVWRALLDTGMGVTALVRNLANMTRLGVLEGSYRKLVVERLADQAEIRASRIHPVAILLGLATYASGRGLRGQNTWQPVSQVIDALDGAFYLAFGNVEPTGKRILQAIDISGSMGHGSVAGTPLSPREAAAALALLNVHVEDDVDTVTFSCDGRAGGWTRGLSERWGRSHGLNDGIEPYGLSRRQRLDDVVRETAAMRMGGTDCALPMLYALERERSYDAFVIYTDSETWAGSVHPAQALQDYRRRTGIAARLAVVGIVSNGFSIADPDDAGMLDIVGMDTATPNVIADFFRGRI